MLSRVWAALSARLVDMVENPGGYRKLWAALGGFLVEWVGHMADAPSWLLAMAAVVASYVVYQVPNDQAPAHEPVSVMPDLTG